MAERVIENDSQEVPEIPEALEKILLFALDEAKSKMEQLADVIPFTVLAVKDNLFIETHPGDSAEECFNFAEHTVKGARGADAYAFCYDGYIETDDGVKDAIIAEGGVPGDDDGYAIGYLYVQEEEGTVPTFESEPAFIGDAPNFMMNLKPSTEYADDDIEDKYLEEIEDETEGK